MCYVTSQVTATEFNVFATDFAVCWTITIIFNTVLVLVMKATKCNWRTAVAQWLRCCATNRKVAVIQQVGDRGSTVVKVLCYKPEGRWFDSR